MFNLKLKALNRFKTAKKILYLNKKEFVRRLTLAFIKKQK